MRGSEKTIAFVCKNYRIIKLTMIKQHNNKQHKRQKTFVLSLHFTPFHFLSLLIIFLCNFQFAWSQCTVKGVLFDEKNGEAVPFANVVLDGTTAVPPTSTASSSSTKCPKVPIR